MNVNGIEESFDYYSLSSQGKQDIYNIFKTSYEKSTGTSWDFNKFNSRAGDWMFFGDSEGYVTLRPQRSGYYKLTGVAGGMKSIMRGLKEIGEKNIPVWGMASRELANVLVNRYGYRKPNKLETMAIFKLISANVFGDVQHTVNKDGGVTFNYNDVGSVTKYFIGNPMYFSQVKRDFASKIKNKVSDKIKGLFNEDNDVDLDEARRTPYKENTFEEIHKMIDTLGYDKMYLSFRSTNNVSLVNKNNKFNTPTGLYCYPMKSYQNCTDNAQTIKEFTHCYLYQKELEFMHIFTLENDQNVLFSLNPDLNKINQYVTKIEERYATNDYIMQYCKDFKDKTFDRYGEFSVIKENEVSRLWLLLYAVSDQIKRGSLAHTVSILASWIGINGFVDDAGLGYIHTAEPHQAVFFVGNFRSITGNYKVFSSHADRGDIDLRIDKTGVSQDDRVQILLTKYRKKFQTNDVYFINQTNKMILNKLKDNIPIPTSIEGIKYFIDRQGNKSVEGVTKMELMNGYEMILAYFNTKIPEYTFTSVKSGYGENYILRTDNHDDIIVRYGEGIVNLESYELDQDSLRSYGSEFIKLFINAKNKSNYNNFGVFDEKKQIIGYDENNVPHMFNPFGVEIPKDEAYINLGDYYLNEYNKNSDMVNFIVGNLTYVNVGNFNIQNGEIAKALLVDGSTKFINKKGEIVNPQFSIQEFNNLDRYDRTSYMNTKYGENKFDYVSEFETYYDNHAMARKAGTSPYINYFIDINGNITNEEIDLDKIKDSSDSRQAYFNSFKDNVEEYEYVYSLKEFLDDFMSYDNGIENTDGFYVGYKDDNKIIINKDGVIPENFEIPKGIEKFPRVVAAYLNTNIKENKYEYVYQSFKDPENQYLAGYSQARYVYINKKTHELDLGNVVIEDFLKEDWDIDSYTYGNKRQNTGAYFNTLFKTNKFGRFNLIYNSEKKGYRIATADDNWYLFKPETGKIYDYYSEYEVNIDNIS